MRYFLSFFVLCLLSSFVCAQYNGPTKLVLLGTGTPFADPDHQGQAIAIVVGNSSYIFDCGPGVVRQAAAAAKKFKLPALQPENLRRLFITHLHSDHTVGYPDILLTPAVIGRAGPLEVYGPPGTRQLNDHILAAYGEDIHLRLDDLEHGNGKAYAAVVHEIREDGIVYSDSNVTVSAFHVPHGNWKDAYGYKIKTKDRTIVLSGDCTYSETLIREAMNCDILVHEVYSTTGYAQKDPQMKIYHAHYHTSSEQLAVIAGKAHPGLLILNHALVWKATEADLLREMKEKYQGKMVLGHDLEMY